MSNDKKYNPKTIMALLKLMLAVRDNLSKEEKESVIKLAEQIILNNRKQDYEDKQIFPIKDHKRRN
jgi:hypothetical protein